MITDTSRHRVLDCTLRDGAHVNRGFFGVERIHNIISRLVEARIDIVEIGFLTDLTNGEVGRTLFKHLDAIEHYVDCDHGCSSFSVMVRPDQCSLDKLDRKVPGIDILRFAFHSQHLDLTQRFLEKGLELGYSVCANPVNVTMYPHDALKRVLRVLHDYPLDTLSVVDTFGALTLQPFNDLVDLFLQELAPNVALGLHLHENMNQAFGLISSYLEENRGERSTVLDGSLYGMGRIPGNLCTEVILSYLNAHGANYNLQSIMRAISDEIKDERSKKTWGYAPVYLLTAERNIHRSYGEHLDDMGVPLDKCISILDEVAKTGPASRFDKEAIERIRSDQRKAAKAITLTACIPVKANSTRLPNKNMLDFHGESLLARKIRQLKEVEAIDTILVSSDSREMLRVAEEMGCKIDLRPLDLADESRPFADFLDYLSNGVITTEHLLWACCTSPLMSADSYRRAITAYWDALEQGFDSLITVFKFRHFLLNDDGPMNFKRGRAHVNSQELPSFDIFTNGAILAPLDGLRAWHYHFGPNVFRLDVNQAEAIDIDTLNDYLMALALDHVESR